MSTASPRNNLAVANTSVASVAAVPAAVLACPAEMSVPVRRIATFHTHGLCDLIFTLPALHSLRESFPGAAITSVVPPPLASLLRGSPLVDEVLLRPRGGLPEQARMMKRLHDHHFDLALAFSGTRKTALYVFSTGAPTRVGYAHAKMEALFTHHVEIEGAPNLETHLQLAAAAGCRPHAPDYRGLLSIDAEYSVRAQTLLDEAQIASPFIAVAPSTNRKSDIRAWPVSRWTAAIEELSTRWPIALVGLSRAPLITDNLKPQKYPVIDLGGRTDLSTLAALCGKAALFCGLDNGATHLAAAMETPVAAIFDSNDERAIAPRGVAYRIVAEPDGLAQAARELIGV